MNKLKKNLLNSKNITTLILIISLGLVFAAIVSAQTNIPIGLQKILDYNKQSTLDFSTKISFIIAFVAGMLGILSPCIIPFIPAYFSYTFKEKKNITKMTLVFFAGFSLVFIALGMIAGYLGQQSMIAVQSSWIVTIAGFFLIIMGVMSMLGKGFSSFIKIRHKMKNDVPGVFLFGIFYAIGWSACLGPILAGILGIGAILNNIWYSALLLFFYSLGNLVPLFIISMFYDRFNLADTWLIKGKLLHLKLFGSEFYVHTTNLVSGIFFLIIGIILVVFKGTGKLNDLNPFGTEAFYSTQRKLIEWQ